MQQAACFESLKTHGDPTNQCGWTASLAAGARGGGSCRRQQFDAMNRPAPAGSHPNKTCSKNTNIQAANSPRRNAGIHCSDGDGDVIKRTRPADYRTIYCVPIIPSVVSAGT